MSATSKVIIKCSDMPESKIYSYFILLRNATGCHFIGYSNIF